VTSLAGALVCDMAERASLLNIQAAGRILVSRESLVELAAGAEPQGVGQGSDGCDGSGQSETVNLNGLG
jgi:hypothetical protein